LDHDFIYPVHLNPNVQQPVKKILADLPNVFLIDLLGYFDFIYIMKRSHLILTDSGGIQEEAPTLKIPTLVMRDTTERPEGVAAGVVKLAGVKQESIVKLARALLTNQDGVYDQMSSGASPYGDGRASYRILEALRDY
jgi:UDP-N-acetylglucosamine 2-epimerase (non-hydrolysing)